MPPPQPPESSRWQHRDYVALLTRIGLEHGLDKVGVAPAEVFHRALAVISQRKADGLSDTMQFTYRNPVRSTNPAAGLGNAQSVVVAARSYMFDPPEITDRGRGGPMASVARYAWVDHYEPLRAGLRAIAAQLNADGHGTRVFVDDNALVDREAAWLGGLGWFGKNANLLLPGLGSYFVLGSLVTTASLETNTAPMADGCGACRRCIDACPTKAIVAEGVVDAGRCIAWILQRAGVIPVEFRAAIGDRLYGCDECQTVCPPSVRSERKYSQEAIVSAQAQVSVLEVLDLDDEALLGRFGRWYIAERNPMWLRRNALVVLGNVGDPHERAVIDVLARYLVHAEPMLRAHAVWAAARLQLLSMLPLDDPNPLVRSELLSARA